MCMHDFDGSCPLYMLQLLQMCATCIEASDDIQVRGLLESTCKDGATAVEDTVEGQQRRQVVYCLHRKRYVDANIGKQ